MKPRTPASALPDADRAAVWHVQLLGRAQASPGSSAGPARAVLRWPTRACVCLLARLALAPQRLHTREELIGLLWPDAPPPQGRARLRTTLSQLRSLLEPAGGTMPPVIRADRQAIEVAPGALSCDVLRFQQAVLAGDAPLARSLYAGELLPGHYDDWVLAERASLEQMFEQLAQPAPRGMVSAAAKQGETAPVDGPRQAGGRRATVTLLGPLPHYWTEAFGQEPAVTQLGELVGANRLVTLLGPGGIGKTRLATALANRLLAQAGPLPAPPFARIVFAPVADSSHRDTLLQALQALLQPGGQPDAEAGILGALQGEPTLLVLDNVEQFEESAGQAVASWLHRLPLMHVLLTSRRRLGLDGERVFELQGLALSDASDDGAPDAAAAMACAAVALFVDRARASRPGFHLTPDNTGAVLGLTHWLDGMPLAIELAASRLRALQPRELLDRLQQGQGSPLLDLLARPQAASGRARHASMRQVVQWSWQQLNPAQAGLLRAMSVFSAPASVQAVAQACEGLHEALVSPALGPDLALADTTVELAQVQALLAELVDASLLQVLAAAGASISLYQLLPPVREFAAEQGQPREAAAVRSRLRRWLAACAREGLPQRRAELLVDLPHAWHLLVQARQDGAPREALALAVPMQGEWAAQAAAPAVQAALEWALACVGSGAPDALASQGHYVLAALNQMRADAPKARRHADAAITLAPDDRCRGLALSLRCWIGLQTGAALDSVRAELDEALFLARRSADPRAVALILRLQASLQLHHREDPRQAAALLQESIGLFEAQGNVQQACSRQIELAFCWACMGRHAEALDLAQACVQRCRSLGLAMVLIYALTGLGSIQLLLRQPHAAGGCLQEAARLAQRDGWSSLLLPALLPLSQAWLRCGDGANAALLLGHVLDRWPAQLGRINRVDARVVRRTRRLLGLALGSQVAARRMALGRVLTLDQIMQRRQSGSAA